MKRKYKVVAGVFAGLLAGIGIGMWMRTADFQVLNAQGVVADKQLQLLIFATSLSLLVVIPVFGLLTFIALRYREGGSKKRTYSPDWDNNNAAEALWWGIPCILIGILSVVIWTSSHELDPYRPLESDKQPVNVQVVALQWRWLFIYPDEGIATINHLKFPEKTPVNFTITADAPMNSFWIPNLGGQVYAMSGMSTKLHLEANNVGEFNGSSANLSGKGFSKMKFTATALKGADYENWVQSVRSEPPLDWTSYEKVSQPTEDMKTAMYQLTDTGLYDKIVNKYMPEHGHDNSHNKGHGE